MGSVRACVAGALIGAVAGLGFVFAVGVATGFDLSVAAVRSLIAIIASAPVVLGAAGCWIGCLIERAWRQAREATSIAEDLAVGWMAELRRQNEDLERLATDRSRFFAALSHDLRTPITAILGFAEILDAEGTAMDPDELVGCFDAIESSARHLLEMVTELLDTAKMEAGVIELQIESAEIGRIVEDCVRQLRPLAWKKGLELTVDVGAEIRALVDPGRLRQVVTNLVSNAIEYTDEGSVTVLVDGDDAGVVVTVVDTGVGVDGDDMAELFTPYVQTEAGRRRTDSIGLGLPVAQALAQAMGGTITAASGGAGRGSSFTLRLPADDAGATPGVVEATLAAVS